MIQGCGSNSKDQGYAGFDLRFHLPRGHFGYLLFEPGPQYVFLGWLP